LIEPKKWAKKRLPANRKPLTSISSFIVCEGFNTPPFRAVKKALNPETNTLPKQHTSPFRARLLIIRLVYLRQPVLWYAPYPSNKAVKVAPQ
jgi:hypothetical protein